VFRVADGNRAPGIEARWLRNGETELLSVQAIEPYAAPTDITVELTASATVRDLRRGGQPQSTRRFHLTLNPVEPTILALAR
jgi:hypothetical protein